MTMPASLAGDMSLGHTGFSPSPITPTTVGVLIMGKPPHVLGDLIGPHVLGQAVHPGTILKTSTKTFFANKPAARLMDKGSCGAMIMGSGGQVLLAQEDNMALEWQKPGKSKPEMVITLEDLKDAANQAIRELKERRTMLKEKLSEGKDGEMGK